MKTTLLLSVLCAALAVAASESCGSETCANDESCSTSTTTCQCNSTVYQVSANSPAPTFTCDGGKFNIDVSKCWLEKNGYNTSSIRLNSTDTTCLASREVVNGISQMGIHRPLTTNDCNTIADVNTTHVTYRNELYIYAKTFPVQTRRDASMKLSCTYPLSVSVALNVTLHPILGTTEITGPNSNASYTVSMIAYTDKDFSIPLTDSDIVYVEDYLYISLVIPGLDTNTLQLKVLTITAFPDNSSTISYDILQNGCPAPNLPADQMTTNINGAGNEARFTMKVFQISGSNTVRLSANVFLCSANCVSNCSSQSKSAESPESVGTVSINLGASDRYYDISSASGSPMPWTLSALIFSWILVKLL